jgi:hypothetical protein
MKQTASFLLLLISISFYAQNPINYKLIGESIKNSKSEFYYPDLMNKFQIGDTTLTSNQKRHLYYGYTFQDNFKNFRFNGLLDSISKYESLNTKNDLLKVLKFRQQLLDKNPFETGVIDGKIRIYRILGNNEEYMKGIHQISLIFDTILSSGDGLSKETAFTITSITAEFNIVSMLGFSAVKEAVLVDNNYDFIEVSSNDKNVKGIYFDVSRTTFSLN